VGLTHTDWWWQQKREQERNAMEGDQMKVSDVYGGQYLKAIMVGENRFRLSIKRVDEELVGQEQDRKLVVYFTQTDKGLVLNATNANTLAEAYGDDTDAWPGKVVTLYTDWTEFGGRRMKGLRVDTTPAAQEAPKTAPVQTPPWDKTISAPEEPVYEDELDAPPDDLPF